jgi:hypothetical protein
MCVPYHTQCLILVTQDVRSSEPIESSLSHTVKSCTWLKTLYSFWNEGNCSSTASGSKPLILFSLSWMSLLFIVSYNKFVAFSNFVTDYDRKLKVARMQPKYDFLHLQFIRAIKCFLLYCKGESVVHVNFPHYRRDGLNFIYILAEIPGVARDSIRN